MQNCAHIQGRLVREPETRATRSGKTCCFFTLANERVKDETNFIKCVAWGKTAELVQQYCHQGSMIIADGFLKYRDWEGTRGKQEGLELIIEKFHFCGNSKNYDKPREATNSSESEDFEEITDNDLPF